MRWTERVVSEAGGSPGSPPLICVTIDLPDRSRPRRSDIADHLTPYLGSPDRTLRSAPGEPLAVDLNVVWPSVARPWITAYTVGASSRPLTVPPGERSRCSPFVELILRLPPTWVPERVCTLCSPPRPERDPLADGRTAWPFEWLSRLARMPHEQGSFLGVGHSVEIGDADEFRSEHGLPYSGFYLDPGYDAAGDRAVPPLRRADGARVEFLGVVPLFSAEVQAIREGRPGDVLRLLDAAKVTDLLDPGRPICVPGASTPP